MTKESWQSTYKSVKLETTVQILQYHLQEDNRPPLKLGNSDSAVALVPNTEVARPPLASDQRDKFVIFSFFTHNVMRIVQVRRFFIISPRPVDPAINRC